MAAGGMKTFSGSSFNNDPRQTMEDTFLWRKLTVAILAAWRITHLLAREDGPGDIIARVRVSLGQSFLGRAMDCFQCISIWVAAPLALYLSEHPLEFLLLCV